MGFTASNANNLRLDRINMKHIVSLMTKQLLLSIHNANILLSHIDATCWDSTRWNISYVIESCINIHQSWI